MIRLQLIHRASSSFVAAQKTHDHIYFFGRFAMAFRSKHFWQNQESDVGSDMLHSRQTPPFEVQYSRRGCHGTHAYANHTHRETHPNPAHLSFTFSGELSLVPPPASPSTNLLPSPKKLSRIMSFTFATLASEISRY